MRALLRSRVFWISIATVAAVATVLAIVLLKNDGHDRRIAFVNDYVQLTLCSNREVAGLEYAYFSLSNRTPHPLGYTGDRNRKPLSSVIEERYNPRVGRVVRTNHSLARLLQMRFYTLAPHSNIDFMVYYPSSVRNAVLSINYFPTKSRFDRSIEDLKLKTVGKPPKPTNEFDSIKLKLPLRRN